MNLYTDRLLLRPWKKTDAADLYAYAGHPLIGPAAGWPAHSSIEHSEEIITNVLSAKETYAVCFKTDGRAIGSAGLMIGKNSHLMLPDTEAELGYWIGVPFWGQGLIPEACAELLRHAFEDLKIEAVWCGHYDGNEKSHRVQQKLHFSYQYTLKNVPCELLDEIRTEHISKITRRDWAR